MGPDEFVTRRYWRASEEFQSLLAEVEASRYGRSVREAELLFGSFWRFAIP